MTGSAATDQTPGEMSRFRGSLLRAALALLTAILVCGAVLAPLYARAVDQSTVHTRIVELPLATTGVTVTSLPTKPSFIWESFPRNLRRYFDEPIVSRSVTLGSPGGVTPRLSGLMTHREGQCDHLEFSRGRCPRKPDEIAVSTADADVFGWSPGERVPVVETASLEDDPSARGRRVRVVGVYTADAEDPYWFGGQVSGHSGLMQAGDSQSPTVVLHDWWFTSAATFDGAADWEGVFDTQEMPLDPSTVGIDDLSTLGPALSSYLMDPPPSVADTTAHSGMPDLAEDIEAETDQAGDLIVVFVVQLSVLTALTVWLVLAIAVGQRRAEAAVLRLRGGSRRAVRRYLARRLLPTLGAGYVGGILLAFAVSSVVRWRWLPAAPFEVTLPVVAAMVGVGAALLLFLLLAVRRLAAERPAALLRNRFRATNGAIAGVALTVAVTVSLGAFVAFAAGSLTGPVGMAAPGLLALGIGLLTAPAASGVLSRVGAAALAKGRLALGLGLVQAGRRDGTNVIVVVVAVAMAILVFAVQSVVVGERNRDDVARAASGAAAVLTFKGSQVADLRAAVEDVDPSGRKVTPVVAMSAAGKGATTTMAVEPDGFARMTASAPGDRLPTDLLTPKGPGPIRITGERVKLRMRASLDDGKAVDVRIIAVNAVAHRVTSLDGRVTNGGSWRSYSLAIDCSAGCLLVGIAVLPADGAWTAAGVLEVDRVRVSGQALDLGTPGAWRGGESIDATTDGSGLRLGFSAPNSSGMEFAHASTPARLPAIIGGRLPPGSDGDDFDGTGLDGINRPMSAAGRIPYVPGGKPNTALVSLDALERDGTYARDVSLQAWLDSDDPSLIDRVADQASEHGLELESTRTSAELKEDFDRAAVGRGLAWGVGVGVVAGLLALLVLVIAVAVSWRSRTSDYRAWRSNRMRPRLLGRVALAELVPAPLIGVVLGLVCGLVGTRVALPHVPFFTTPPEVPVLTTSVAWVAAILTAVGGIVAGSGVSVVAAARLRREEMDR